MEQSQDQSLFDMSMNSETQNHLLSISKWTKFISITGFVIGALVLLVFAAYGQTIFEQVSILLSLGNSNEIGIIIAAVVIAGLFTVSWLFFLFKASNLLKKGLANRNTAQLADGFKAMRVYFILSFILSAFSIVSTLQKMF